MPQKYRTHSFRGLLNDGDVKEIDLERQNMNVAYRITKFEILPETVYTFASFSMLVWRESQASVLSSASIDFNDTDLLAAGAWAFGSGEGNIQSNIIFDNVLFSRNIFVTLTEETTSDLKCNFYLELEEVPVTSSTLMQLKLGVARKLNLQQD